ncbi:hypothetical protein PCANC_26278 [Puccinia coronata f. sp. avenae]|uniref:Uncharacterized protein n=1 Tax=Puccinia coronata f. sp. avenae TaxID=200324 RepID=A0A2N5UGL6_9BASI|nr:hypothetical protein PCANC_26278 [Puccinia coronata f. sp. avenae]
MQIGQFVKTKELKQELEAMNSYDNANWDILRPAMMEIWGEQDNTILHTPQDLIDLSGKYSKKGGLATVQEYKTYLGRFSIILQYLIKNEQLRAKEDASYQFLTAFSLESQKNIKQALVNPKQLPKGPKGSSKPPKWQHVLLASEAKIQVEEPVFSNVTGFANKAVATVTNSPGAIQNRAANSFQPGYATTATEKDMGHSAVRKHLKMSSKD